MPRGWGCAVQFINEADRLAHTIELVSGDRSLPLLRSCEGTDQQAFPPSPPLQQIAIQSLQQRHVALLIGMAGRSHWSVSVESDGTDRRLHFDIACRMAAGGEASLASTYQVLNAPTIQQRGGEIQIDTGEARCLLRTLALEPGGAAPMALQGATIRICPTDLPGGRTRRWCYEMRCFPRP